MIRGMSNENPAELRDRLMLKIWSAYDVTGDVMRLFAQRWSASTNPSGSSAILRKSSTHKNGAPYCRAIDIRYILEKLQLVAS